MLRQETLISQLFAVGLFYVIHLRMFNDALSAEQTQRAAKNTELGIVWAEQRQRTETAPRGKSSEDWDLKPGSPRYEAADSVV